MIPQATHVKLLFLACASLMCLSLFAPLDRPGTPRWSEEETDAERIAVELGGIDKRHPVRNLSAYPELEGATTITRLPDPAPRVLGKTGSRALLAASPGGSEAMFPSPLSPSSIASYDSSDNKSRSSSISGASSVSAASRSSRSSTIKRVAFREAPEEKAFHPEETVATTAARSAHFPRTPSHKTAASSLPGIHTATSRPATAKVKGKPLKPPRSHG